MPRADRLGKCLSLVERLFWRRLLAGLSDRGKVSELATCRG